LTLKLAIIVGLLVRLTWYSIRRSLAATLFVSSALLSGLSALNPLALRLIFIHGAGFETSAISRVSILIPHKDFKSDGLMARCQPWLIYMILYIGCRL